MALPLCGTDVGASERIHNRQARDKKDQESGFPKRHDGPWKSQATGGARSV